jgi:phospholipid/cholesterol/gamma-HCH transport system substrate-binding protein
MADSVLDIAAGAATLAVAAGFLAYAVQTTADAARPDETYALTASFRSVEGVAPGTEVRLAGLPVGRVTDMALDPESFRARLIFTVDADLAIPEDSSVAIAVEGLLGGAYVDILPGASPFALEPGDAVAETTGAQSVIDLIAGLIAAASRP